MKKLLFALLSVPMFTLGSCSSCSNARENNTGVDTISQDTVIGDTVVPVISPLCDSLLNVIQKEKKTKK